MELFSEIYGCYYTVVSKILQDTPMTKKQIDTIIRANAFSETPLYLMPKLTSENGWGLLHKKDNMYYSNLKNPPSMPMTTPEKRWLKALLYDPRIRLFYDEKTLAELSEKLVDVKPLYKQNQFRFFDIFTDGDDYADENYTSHFKTILSAIGERRVLTIEFSSGKGNHIKGNFLPCRIEYSQKNDKFRVYSATIKNGVTVSFGTINISRIQSIKPTEHIYHEEVDMARIFKRRRCAEPITLQITNERNGLERFMMEFAGFEKHTEYDEETRKCKAELWYDSQDETEIIIRLLSYGPIIKVTGPQDILSQVKERINKQYDLLYPKKENTEQL